MTLRSLLAVAGLALPISAGYGADSAPAPTVAGVEFFERHIRPIFVDRCYECHSSDAKELAGDLLLDSRQGWAKGGDSGPALVPGQPDKSLLVRAVRYADSDLKMPPKSKLPEREIELLAKWISMGAPDPRDGTVAQKEARWIDIEAGKSFWAFQPPSRPAAPAVKNTAWIRTDIDRFILAALEEKGIKPTPPADPRTLIRRAYFDLIGLPPTPEEVEEFVCNYSNTPSLQYSITPSGSREWWSNGVMEKTYAALIDKLLASPHYGERWGRHWLDVARYADSNGLDENMAFGNAWRYRDYVVSAFNRDKPYDQFVMEQIAGDLLPTEDDELRRERLVATGFLSLGPKVLAEPDATKMEMDIIDEQVDTLGKTFLGLTLGCARCHDHKFDPIPTADYYALAGIFRSTKTIEKRPSNVRIARWWENSLGSAEEERSIAEHQAKIDALKEQVKTAKGDEQAALETQLKTLEKNAPAVPSALGVADAEAVNLRVHRRGNHLTLGEEVPRGFIQVVVNSPVVIPEKQSGRLELARWIARKDHPLTARVMVNRIWRWHFGQGLVDTADNFGQLGERPSNAALLDWLAIYLVEHNWSVKAVHRLIMRSSAYRLSSGFVPASAAVDPENRLCWRMNLQRLEAEAIRDSMLAVAGSLARSVGGDTCKMANRKHIFDHTSKDETGYDSLRRSIYLPVVRNHVYDLFQQFDFPEPSVVSGDRPTTTVAPQALLLLNSGLVMQCSEQFAGRLLEDSLDDRQRVDQAYRLAYGRGASDAEIDRALVFLREFVESPGKASGGDRVRTAWNALAQAILTSNEFVYMR